MIDYHVHPNTFKHGKYLPITEPLKRYIEICRERGIVELGFSEHGPRFHPTYNHTALKIEEIPVYVQTLREFSQQQSDVKVKVGIEIDYAPELEDVWREIIEKYDFDFTACSIHYLDDWLPTKEGMAVYMQSGKGLEKLYAKYYTIMQRAAQSRLFSFMAHPDLIKIHALVNRLPHPPNLINLYEEICGVLKEYDQVIEFDTGWKKGDFNCFRPEPEFLEIAFRHGVPITLGSDAHRAEDVGSYYPEALEVLRKTGYTQLASFAHGKRSFIPLVA